jgi:hypothetical protein
MADNNLNISSLIKKLGYSLENGNNPAYTLALNLLKIGFDRDEIIQAVTIAFPPKKISLH